jgi:23S rRNA (cytidine1920-2'-O)/16S rRNA (cytidine1409-2'-O)-methyltransferase
VGHNQLDWRLRTDERVEAREGVNARHLRAEDFAERFDLAVMDVSFISATKVLPAVAGLLKPGGRAVVLVKPQFEVGRGEVGKGGVVRDPAQHERVVAEVTRAAAELGLAAAGVIESPILGAEGNREFLALYEQVS